MATLLLRNSAPEQSRELKMQRDMRVTGVLLSHGFTTATEDTIAVTVLRLGNLAVATPVTGDNNVLAMLVGTAEFITAAGVYWSGDSVFVGGLRERIRQGDGLVLLNKTDQGTVVLHESAALVIWEPI